jgi:hypothetical protein
MFSENGAPLVGDQRNQLGVITNPKLGNVDVHPVPFPDGDVGPGEGMSVAPHWTKLHPRKIPKRLDKIAYAIGSNDLVIWRHGKGGFSASAINRDLVLGHVKPRHGLVEPATNMSITHFQQALKATRGDWIEDEEPMADEPQ